MASTRTKTSRKEKELAAKALRAISRKVDCRPLTCKISNPLCGNLTSCDITCKIAK